MTTSATFQGKTSLQTESMINMLQTFREGAEKDIPVYTKAISDTRRELDKCCGSSISSLKEIVSIEKKIDVLSYCVSSSRKMIDKVESVLGKLGGEERGFVREMMLRENLPLEEAQAEWRTALAEMREALKNGENPEEVLLEMFGLEACFIEEFLPWL